MKDRALPLFVVPLLLAPLAATSPQAVAQSINRCEAADGTTIFTDKSCAAFGATPAGEIAYDDGSGGGDLRDPPGTLGINGATGGFAIKGCARTQGELIAGVRGAIESGDVNRLTNYYHWTGVSSSASVGLLDRLDKVVRNTLSGVQFDYAPTYDYTIAAAASRVPEAYDAYEEAYEAYEAAGPRPMPVTEVVYTAGPSYMDRYRQENDDVPVLSSGTVDASTPLDEARAMYRAGSSYGYPETRANPQPVALRVNNGGGGGTRFSLRQNAGCWFIQY